MMDTWEAVRTCPVPEATCNLRLRWRGLFPRRAMITILILPLRASDDYDFDPPSTSADDPKDKSCTCRDVFDHVNGCNICKAFYMEGRNNFMLYLIIVVLLLIIVFLITKVYDIHLKRSK
jgi:hypothetical protein